MKIASSVGILAALPLEARCFTQQSHWVVGLTLPIAPKVLLHVSGIGAECAKNGALTLLNQGVNVLISWGSAGGLAPSVQAGHVVIPERIIHPCGDEFRSDQHWQKYLQYTLLNHLIIHSGALLQAPEIVTSVRDKRALFVHHHAVAVDMESAAIAAVAQQAGLPFVAIRAIVDSAALCLPTWFDKTVNPEYGVDPFTFFRQVMTHPRSWLPLIRLAHGYHVAQASLAYVVKQMEWC